MTDAKPARITSPFNAKSTALEVIAGYDLSGKTAVVTGAASGIGTETARALLTAGARVLLAVRDTAKGEQVVADLRQSMGNANAEVIALDLSSLESVRQGAAEILNVAPKIDILINNAGVMATPQSQTADGFEMQFGTNHLGHFLLTELLMPALLAAAPSRVVALSSIGHRRSNILLDDLNLERRPYDKWEAYGNAKTANALFALGLNDRYAKRGVTANSVHPGGIMTGLQKHMPMEEQRAMGWMDEEGNLNPVFKSTEQGAATSVWAAVGKELEGVGGLYLEDVQEAVPFEPAAPYSGYQPYLRDHASADKLWEASEKMVGLK
ncbi:SDR family NAD(P)-dependent oxidoreductase [Deinococcus psychrotolerans]|uniref:Probable oxidoreductase n=1 Tax=Deinococcus psychrotolerans TaxID=2489213 RepID=A0A3G8YLP9_9DEIO|nr:oxidoreductase [Deinococcus psychrotolerans]AZI43544.1 SDR family NAD(P)-dependent oxidoreductase [Deinococcus psychrotolerans]